MTKLLLAGEHFEHSCHVAEIVAFPHILIIFGNSQYDLQALVFHGGSDHILEFPCIPNYG